MKRVLLLVVDGCTPSVLGPALERGELPVLADLGSRGSLSVDCVSIFPSITPAATASIVTGAYPAQHGIAGMSWYDESTGHVAYFGDDVWTVLQRGLGDFLRGFLLRLNGERLQAPTLFQLVERHQRRAACFNHLIFRGDVEHQLSPPLLLQLLPSIGSTLSVQGPSWLCLGDFISTTGRQHTVDTEGGVFNRFGMDDQGTEAFLRDLPDAAALPDFTVAYFADYDFDSHEKGPRTAASTLRRLDRRLSAIFDQWGGIDRVLDDTCIMLTADHAHSEIRSDRDAAIVLDDVLQGHRLADPADGWHGEDELLLCPNMRAAEIYVGRRGSATTRDVCDGLLQDPRIDHVIWREARGDGDAFHVATSDRGSLRFWRSAHATDGARDEYDTRWHIEGDWDALDISVQDKTVRSAQYPNALERIAGGVDHPRGGRVWVTARLGYEFNAPGQSVHHDAGSHGTLHAGDSLVPLLIAGAPEDVSPHTTPRIIDVVPWAAIFLGIPFDRRPGDRHG